MSKAKQIFSDNWDFIKGLAGRLERTQMVFLADLHCDMGKSIFRGRRIAGGASFATADAEIREILRNDDEGVAYVCGTWSIAREFTKEFLNAKVQDLEAGLLKMGRGKRLVIVVTEEGCLFESV